MLVFSTQLCELLLLWPSLWLNSPPPPLPCVNKYTACYTYTVCKGGYGVLGLRTDKHLPRSPLTGQFFRWRHFALPSMNLIFLRLNTMTMCPLWDIPNRCVPEWLILDDVSLGRYGPLTIRPLDDTSLNDVSGPDYYRRIDISSATLGGPWYKGRSSKNQRSGAHRSGTDQYCISVFIPLVYFRSRFAWNSKYLVTLS